MWSFLPDILLKMSWEVRVVDFMFLLLDWTYMYMESQVCIYLYFSLQMYILGVDT